MTAGTVVSGCRLRRLVYGAAMLAVVLAAGCATGADRIGSETAASLRRAAESIDRALAEWTRAVEHWRRAVALVAEALPELRATDEWQRLQAVRADALEAGTDVLVAGLLVAGRLRAVADGTREPLPRASLLKLAGGLRELADAGRSVQDVASQLDGLRGVVLRDAVVDELAEAVAALQAAADHYADAADEIDAAAAQVSA